MSRSLGCPHLGDLYAESGQTLQCSFSSVSTPPIARGGAFFSIFHDLQDIHAFAPLETQNFRKILLDFHEISPEFHVNFELLKSRGLPGFFRTLFSFFPGPPLCGLLASSFERVSLPAALRDLEFRQRLAGRDRPGDVIEQHSEVGLVHADSVRRGQDDAYPLRRLPKLDVNRNMTLSCTHFQSLLRLPKLLLNSVSDRVR